MKQLSFIRSPEELSGRRPAGLSARGDHPAYGVDGEGVPGGGAAQQVVAAVAHVGVRRLAGDRARPLDVRPGVRRRA